MEPADPAPFKIGTSMVLPEEEEVWDQWQCPAVDNEFQRLGSPLLTVPTPGRKGDAASRRESHVSTLTNQSSLPAQHVRVVVRVRPPNPFELSSCLDVQHPDAIRIATQAQPRDVCASESFCER